MSQCSVLIVAAGSGERFGGSIPKQYHELAGMPILRRSVLAFLDHPHIDGVQVVISPTHRDLYDKAVADLGLPEPVTGGATRQDSVRLGLEAMAKSGKPPKLVMIHDAARPLIDAATITAVRKTLDKERGAIAAKPLVDTLKRGKGIEIEATIDRENLWQAHTPQAFHFDEILAAHRAVQGSKLTDDAAVAEKAGMKVALVLSNPDNMKITNPDDLDRAARLLGHSYGDIRTGMGFDVHRLVPGDKIFLCGVGIPHNRKLDGHSDADVGLHALTDAILGTMGAGDIGTHFPPSDPQWKGKDSAHFIRHAVGMVSERGGFISHVDVTMMCEAPRIGPHREAMVKRLAELLEIDPSRVSVKATTTERLGFTGREEGIAAQAIATVRFPG
ncbi:MAG TPA: bifunctional 2-C-methyl-D-erythritol 4-phosphate cytidylyltransferase/2-C-methyl-D-erythritol 2,4-cyclodiphosphate synthase [Alphaproteobacteria bacterium]|nr:bifunctional 2-C-methyl-D-erythritol 4-phosphate cytidylyltransferase/2-C-methyl-D-erythritol 2,4-cyclodiphosphate synthase [Alphaproteobacteria bacterium]